MKNPFSFFTRKNLETSFGVLQSRFPVASIIVLVLTGFLFYIIHAEPESIVYVRIILSLIVTFFLSIGVSLFLETKKIPHQNLWHALSVVYGILFYITMIPLTNEWMLDSITYFVLHLVGFIGLLFFAPYSRNLFYKKEQSVEYTNYFSRVAWTLLMSVIVGGSMVALGFIAIGSVMALFELSNIQEIAKIYGYWATLSLSLVAPLYCLIHLPRIQEIEKGEYEVDRFFSFLIRYIATPFIVLYFIILYAYSAKVLLNFHDWPKGMISWMVIGFSSFGYLTYIFSKSYEEESKTITIFRQYFPYAVPAQILMLAYAIYLRIAQYDLTMNRYFVVIFGCWLALISAYYILSEKKSLTIVSASLTVIALIISVGPWSVYRLPLIRQYNHLVQNLTTAGMYKDGVILKKGGTLETALESDIYSEIEYVCGFSRCEKIKTLFAKELTGKEEEYAKKWRENEYNKDKEYPGMSQWEVINEVTTVLNIQNRGIYGVYTAEDSKYINLNTKNAYSLDDIFPLSVEGYRSIIRVNASSFSNTSSKQYALIDIDNETLMLYGYGDKRIMSLKGINGELQKRFSANNSDLSSSDLTFVLTSGKIEVKLIMQSYSIKNPKYSGGDNLGEYTNISGYALVRGE